MKICVYAISKNEEKFVKRFCESIKDADYILIADTGSTDNTVTIAKKRGAIVYNIAVHPWRFDTARNIALGLVPKDMDICITLDLDEIMLPGWRNEIERVWIKNETTALEHQKIEKNDGISYKYANIFSRTVLWKGICHEIPILDNPIWVSSNKILVQHIPDQTKSRTFYFDLLKANADEYPNKLLPLYYYARELRVNKKYRECIKISNKFIKLYSNSKKYNNCHYDLNIIYGLKGNCYKLLNNFDECKKNYKLACDMNLHLRRPLIILALLYFAYNNYKKSYKYYVKALSIQTPIRRREEMNPEYWGYSPWNFASKAANKIGKYDKANEYKVKALELQNKICLQQG